MTLFYFSSISTFVSLVDLFQEASVASILSMWIQDVKSLFSFIGKFIFLVSHKFLYSIQSK